MKVMYYIHNLWVGGAETLVTEYLIKLKEKGCQVVLVENEILDTFLERRLKENGIPTVALLPTCSNTFLGKLRRMLNRKLRNTTKLWQKLLEREKPDVIHIHTFTDRLAGVDFPAERMVYTFHADMERSLKIGSDRNSEILERLAREGMHFFSVSEKMCDQIRERFSTQNVICIPNSIDISAVQAKKYDRAAFLASLDIPEKAFVMGHVGRFHPVKNHEKTIEIFAEVVNRGEDAYLLLLGEGEAQRSQRLRDTVDSLGLTHRVRFLGLRQDATQIMSVMDAMVLPSFSESFSIVLVEAQAHHVRCVASTAVPEEVACNPNCFRLEVEAPAAQWADVLLADTQRQTHRDIGVFDLDTNVTRMLQAYAGLRSQTTGEE